MSVHDAREIRAMGQQNGIDIFGGNSLGVADSWQRVRIGGALGGDRPGGAEKRLDCDLLQLGQFHNHHRYLLAHGGWGATTLISSGKDVYIHFAAPEFAFALANDARSKAAVLYVEPGGYYEARCGLHQAGDRVRGRTMEGEAHARRRTCGGDGRRQR